MGTLKTTNIQTITGSGTLTLGTSGETVSFASGVTGLNYPAFHAFISSNQTVSDSVDTKVQCDTELLDTDGCYDNSTNYRFTPTVAGKYFVFGQVRGDSTGADSLARVIVKIFKNGANAAAAQNFGSVTNYSNVYSPFVSVILDMNGTSDYIELFGFVDSASGTPEFVSGTVPISHFGAYRIGT